MREKNSLHGRRRCLAPRHLEQVFSVNALDVRDEAHLDKVNNAVGCPRTEKFFKVFRSPRKPLAKVKKYSCAVIIENNFVPSNFIYATIKCDRCGQLTSVKLGSLISLIALTEMTVSYLKITCGLMIFIFLEHGSFRKAFGNTIQKQICIKRSRITK